MVKTTGASSKTNSVSDTVLVVEDDPGAAILERRRLERAGYAVVCAATAAEALKHIEQGEVKLIVLDQGLPDATGLEFYERLKGSGHDLPVIMVTGLNDSATVVGALRAGLRDFVTKSPEYLDYLVEAVATVLSKVRLEQRLEESEERFRSLVQSASDIIMVLDADGTVRYASPAIERVLGFAPEEVVGDKVLDYVDAGDLEQASNVFAKILSEPGDHPPFEFRVPHKDGSWRFFECTVKNLLDDPSVRGVVVNQRDVTERKRTEVRLREAEEKYRSIVENAVEGIFQTSLEGGFRAANPAMARMLGYESPEELIASVHDIAAQLYVYPSHRGEFTSLLRQHGKVSDFEVQVYRKDGRVIWVSVSARAVYGTDGDIVSLEGMVEDITERKRAEEALRQSEARHVAVLNTAFDAIVTMRLDGSIESFNKGAETVFGYSAKEAIGRPVTLLMPQRFWEAHRLGLNRYLKTGVTKIIGRRRIELWGQRKDGEEFPLELSLTEVNEGEAPLFTAIMRDITERKRTEEQLKHQAFHDALTGLPNRHLFVDRLEQALARHARRGSRVAVMFMDLNNFKIVNDSLGHEAGDQLLVAVSQRLRACVRSEDTVARFGGDEFAILLQETTKLRDVIRVADRIAAELLDPFVLSGQQVFVETSIGIALGTSSQELPEELLRNADTAMYRAKEQGNGTAYRVFDPEMHQQALKRLELENDLRRAIEREEFTVYYQPKVVLETGSIYGFEALVRWKHPKRGLLAPGEFIPLAEETGLIVPIGCWVLKEACRQICLWQERYRNEPPWGISVNLSPKQFHQPRLAEDVAEVLQETGLAHSDLALEVTESVMVQDSGFAGATLEKLRNLGVRIDIDDFGTGYSSFNRLKHLPINTLKIDRSFVARLGEDPRDEHIVQAIIKLASGLELGVVAEGVEVSEQAARLRVLGCAMAQGYYFSKPLPSEAIDALLANQITSD